MWCSILFVLSLLAKSFLCARILCFYTVPSISHQIVFRELTKELVKRGHDLVVVTTDPYLPKNRPPDNIREIDTGSTRGAWERGLTGMANSAGDPMTDFQNIVIPAAHAALDQQLALPEVRELIENKTEHFDLLIIEGVIRPTFFLAHRFKAPVIAFNSLTGFQFNYDVTGTPQDAILYPDMCQSRIFNLTLWEKIAAVYKDYYQRYKYWQRVDDDNRMGKQHFGKDAPDVREVIKNVDLLFLNVHPIWDGIRPTPPNIVYTGGLHLKKPSPLPRDLQSYMDSCTKGVIYMSFGTNIKSTELPPQKIKIFLKVFSKLPHCVLWKWEDQNMKGKPNNVKIQTWLPQGDLFAHPNMLAFITQGGLQSTDEAIDRGVPVIGIPFFADQDKNVQKFVYHGIGIALNIKTLTEDDFSKAIYNIVHDTSYRVNIRRMKTLLDDQPMTSRERAVWWVEYLLRHGSARHLRSPSADERFWWSPLALTALASTSLLVHSVGVLWRLLAALKCARSIKRKLA